jgi:hypothetical protein
MELKSSTDLQHFVIKEKTSCAKTNWCSLELGDDRKVGDAPVVASTSGGQTMFWLPRFL